MRQYQQLLHDVLLNGIQKEPARDGMPTTSSVFGNQYTYMMHDPDTMDYLLPTVTTKKVSHKNVWVEVLWFLSGMTNTRYLSDRGFRLWNEDAYNYYTRKIEQYDLTESVVDYEYFCKHLGERAPELSFINYRFGDCGNTYGKTWTDFSGSGVNQISNVINQLLKQPYSRRHVVSSIDPAQSTPYEIALYWCHALFQFNCRPIPPHVRWQLAGKALSPDEVQLCREKHLKTGRSAEEVEMLVMEDFDQIGIPKFYLDCKLYQRSGDAFLGVPYNITSYCYITHLLGLICNMVPAEFIHSFGDLHLYDNHFEQAKKQLGRDYRNYSVPTIKPSDKLLDYISKGMHRTLSENWSNVFMDIAMDEDWSKMWELDGYLHAEPLKAELSTGMKK